MHYGFYDVFSTLRTDYQYCFSSKSTLNGMEHLIKLIATKHATGDRIQNSKSIDRIMKLNENIIPSREI
jgi:hypothetical protein